jgi:hypothetical protein
METGGRSSTAGHACRIFCEGEESEYVISQKKIRMWKDTSYLPDVATQLLQVLRNKNQLHP